MKVYGACPWNPQLDCPLAFATTPRFVMERVFRIKKGVFEAPISAKAKKI
jgi:hypothetical protein